MENKCIFCNTDIEIISSTVLSFAIYDKFPVSSGHVLIIPKNHVSDYFQLSNKEKADLWLLVEEIKIILDNKFNPDGYNIGFNLGQSAGQTISHVHIHVIPRYIGDVDDPTGGVRNVIPGKGKY